MDWKDALSRIAAELPEGENEQRPTSEEVVPDNRKGNYSDYQPGVVHVLKERKGRAGKVATIIEGFTCDENILLEIAGVLKKRLGTGGSARGGEILIQGDVVDKVKTALSELGIRSKG